MVLWAQLHTCGLENLPFQISYDCKYCSWMSGHVFLQCELLTHPCFEKRFHILDNWNVLRFLTQKSWFTIFLSKIRNFDLVMASCCFFHLYFVVSKLKDTISCWKQLKFCSQRLENVVTKQHWNFSINNCHLCHQVSRSVFDGKS